MKGSPSFFPATAWEDAEFKKAFFSLPRRCFFFFLFCLLTCPDLPRTGGSGFRDKTKGAPFFFPSSTGATVFFPLLRFSTFPPFGLFSHDGAEGKRFFFPSG